MAASCWCFNVGEERTRKLNAEGTGFIARTRGVEIHDRHSPWAEYFDAVYNGQSPLPHQLGRLSFFYTNSRAWRARHPLHANPFRDWTDRQQPRCSASRCAEWERGLLPAGGVIEPMGCFRWPFSPREADELFGIQVFSRDTVDIGRVLVGDHEWVEIIRQDARPYFAEGERPPDCPDWEPGDPYHGQYCWSRLYPYAGGRFAPGCWSRPVAGASVAGVDRCEAQPRLCPSSGSGVWINVGKTRHGESLEEGNAVDYVLQAAHDGVDTMQFRTPLPAPLTCHALTGDAASGRLRRPGRAI